MSSSSSSSSNTFKFPSIAASNATMISTKFCVDITKMLGLDTRAVSQFKYIKYVYVN